MSYQRSKLTHIHPLILGIFLCWIAHPMSAQVVADTTALPKGYGVILGLPAADNDLIGLALLTPPTDVQTASKLPLVLLDAGDRRWLDEIRLSIYRLELLPKLEPKCRLETPLFSTVVDQLEDAINYLDFAQAEGDRWLADIAYACDPEPSSPEHLARFAFFQGLLEQRKSHQDGGWFQVAAELDPNLERVALESEQTQASFRAALKLARTVERVTVPLHLEQAGLSLWIDGKPASGTEMKLLPGVHFIQQVDHTGKVLRGSMELIRSPQNMAEQAELSLPPTSVEVPHAEAVVRRMEETVRIGRLDDVMASAVGALLARGNHPWILLLVPETLSQPARGLWVLAGGAVIPVRLSHELSQAGVVGTGVMAGATLASGIGLAYLLAPLIKGDLLPAGTGATHTNYFIATGIGFGVSLSITGIIASRTWLRPRFLYQQTKLPASLSNR